MKVYTIARFRDYEGYSLWQFTTVYRDIDKARAKAEEVANGERESYGPWKWNGDRTELRGRSESLDIIEYDLED